MKPECTCPKPECAILKAAEKITRDIFARGDDIGRGKDSTQRIAFRGGKYPTDETDLGGMCEQALARDIHDGICRHLP